MHLILRFSESRHMSDVTFKKKTSNVKNKERRSSPNEDVLMRTGILNHKVLLDLYKDKIYS